MTMRRLALYVGLATVSIILCRYVPAVGQVPTGGRALTFKYQDDDGPGRLVVEPTGADEGGASLIRVTLEQNGSRFQGSGVSYPLEARMPFRTLYAFTVTSPRGAYFFRGETTSG